MRFWRRTGIALAWLVVTALGAVVVWAGLRPVLDTALPDRSAPLSVSDLRRITTPSQPPTPSLPPPTTTPRPSRSASPSPSASAHTGDQTTEDGWTVTSGADGTRSYLRSYQVRGGSAVIRMEPGRVFLVSATPTAGFTASSTQSSPDRLAVQFVGTGRSDTVDAMWWQGRPFVQLSHVG